MICRFVTIKKTLFALSSALLTLPLSPFMPIFAVPLEDPADSPVVNNISAVVSQAETSRPPTRANPSTTRVAGISTESEDARNNDTLLKEKSSKRAPQNTDRTIPAASNSVNDIEEHSQATPNRNATPGFHGVVPPVTGEDDMLVDLPDLPKLRTTKWLNDVWNLEKLFGWNIEFSRREFRDQIALIDLDVDAFESKFLKDSTVLADSLGDALEEMEKIKQKIAKCNAFKLTNVYRLVSSGTECSLDTVIAFEDFRKKLKRFEQTTQSFEQLVRGLKGLDNIMEKDPRVRARAPYLQYITATPALRRVVQEEASNKAELAMQRRLEILHALDKVSRTPVTNEEESAVINGVKQELQKNLKQNTIKVLRWQALDYALNPGSLRNPMDKRAAVHQALGVSTNTSKALLSAVETTMPSLSKRYFNSFCTSFGIAPDTDQEKLLLDKPFWNLPYSFPVNAWHVPHISRTWKEIHDFALNAVERVSPSLAKHLQTMDSEGRIFWADSGQLGAEFFNGGEGTGPLLLFHYHANPAALYHYVFTYAGGAICSAADPALLTSPTKDIFQHELACFIAEENARNTFTSNLPSIHRQRNFLASFDTLKRIQLAFSYDQFENCFQGLCDAFGPVRRIRRKQEKQLPRVEAVDHCFQRHVTKPLIDSISPLKSKAATADDYLDVLRTVQSGRYTFINQPFQMNRANYQTLLTLMARCAIQDALCNADGTLKPLKTREAAIQALLSLPSSATFDTYIQALGGHPDDAAYWSRVLTSCFETNIPETPASVAVN